MTLNICRRVFITILFSLWLTGCDSIPLDKPFGEIGGDDKPLSIAVSKALHEKPQTTSMHITVKSDDDVVTLKGFVNSPTERWMAEEVASAVDGVRHVINALYIR